MVIDIHCHLVPEPYMRFVERAKPFCIEREQARGEDIAVNIGALRFALNRTFFDPERMIARMDRMGIECAVVSLATPFVNYTVAPDLAREAAALYNEEIAALRGRYPRRFEGWALLPMQDVDAAANELRRAVRELGLVGGYLPSNIDGQYLDKPQFRPVFDAAVELDVPLFVHPSNPPGRERMSDHELAVVSGYLFDTTLNIFNMVFGGLLDRYPTLRLCLAHVGGYALMLRSRMQREVDTNPALAARISRPVGDYMKALYFDTICFEPGYIRFIAAEVANPEHLLLGSDSPFPLGEPDPVGFIQRSFGDGAATIRDGILHRNAARFLRPGPKEASTWTSARSA
jgi:aminocarboxymuconate-semialdehyde decarboxylase